MSCYALSEKNLIIAWSRHRKNKDLSCLEGHAAFTREGPFGRSRNPDKPTIFRWVGLFCGFHFRKMLDLWLGLFSVKFGFDLRADIF